MQIVSQSHGGREGRPVFRSRRRPPPVCWGIVRQWRDRLGRPRAEVVGCVHQVVDLGFAGGDSFYVRRDRARWGAIAGAVDLLGRPLPSSPLIAECDSETEAVDALWRYWVERLLSPWPRLARALLAEVC